MLEQAVYQSGRSAVDVAARVMLDMDVVQYAPFPEGPKIFAANHPTTTDPFLILTLTTEPMSILIAETCFKVPVFGNYLRAAGHIPVIKDNGRAAFDGAVQLLVAGQNVGIFPEGALSPLNGSLGFCKPRTGAARLALISGAPVVPIGIHLQHERIRFHETTVDGNTEVARWYLNGPYGVTVGEPMRFDGDVEDWEYVRSISARIMGRIIHLSQESALRMGQAQAPATGSVTHPVQVAGRV